MDTIVSGHLVALNALKIDILVPKLILNPSLLENLQNAEILTLTYGSIVRQLIADYDDVDEVNKQLEKMYVNPFSLYLPTPYLSHRPPQTTGASTSANASSTNS
jgi:hypothetical protein